MIELNEGQFRELCRDGRVQLQIETVEQKRRSALGRFWLFVLVAAVAGGLIGFGLIMSGGIALGLFAGSFILLGAILLASRPLRQVGSDLKQPVLERLAALGGLTYAAADFVPPAYEDARRLLFGKWLSEQTFTDLFTGTDAEGRRFALYEATLARSSGKSRTIVFSGQVYTFERRFGGGGPIAVLPDRGLFNFVKPGTAMERVAFDADPAFEKSFEVYAVEPHQALLLIEGDARRALLDLRKGGRVYLQIGSQDVLVAVSGPNRFEAGSMFHARSGEERARVMFDDLRASLAVLDRLRASLG